MSGLLNERFNVIPSAVAGSNTQYSEGAALTLEDVVLSKVNISSKPSAGLTYRFKLCGTAAGATDVMNLVLRLGRTAVMTLAAPGADEVDWMAEFVIRFTDSTNQRVMGYLVGNGIARVVDYAVGTVDCTAGAEMKVQIYNTNVADTVTCEMCTVESWVK